MDPSCASLSWSLLILLKVTLHFVKGYTELHTLAIFVIVKYFQCWTMYRILLMVPSYGRHVSNYVNLLTGTLCIRCVTRIDPKTAQSKLLRIKVSVPAGFLFLRNGMWFFATYFWICFILCHRYTAVHSSTTNHYVIEEIALSSSSNNTI